MIDSMQLDRSVVTLLLSNYLDEDEEEGDWDEEANTLPATKVRGCVVRVAMHGGVASCFFVPLLMRWCWRACLLLHV